MKKDPEYWGLTYKSYYIMSFNPDSVLAQHELKEISEEILDLEAIIREARGLGLDK